MIWIVICFVVFVDVEVFVCYGLYFVFVCLYVLCGVQLFVDIEIVFVCFVLFIELKGCVDVVVLFVDVIVDKWCLLVVVDYDCDGVIVCVVVVCGLWMFGVQIDYLVLNCFEYGYGFMFEIVEFVVVC